MVVDEGEAAISTAFNTIATGIEKTALDGGLKYSSNMGWNKRSQSVLFSGLKGCCGTGFGTSYELDVAGVIY
nr:hypothetical protein [Tanacetum cinerariifolium]